MDKHVELIIETAATHPRARCHVSHRRPTEVLLRVSGILAFTPQTIQAATLQRAQESCRNRIVLNGNNEMHQDLHTKRRISNYMIESGSCGWGLIWPCSCSLPGVLLSSGSESVACVAGSCRSAARHLSIKSSSDARPRTQGRRRQVDGSSV